MRILHLLASPVWSGPAESIALLAEAQRALGHEVTVAVDRRREGTGSEEPVVPRLRALGLLDEGGLELSVKSGPAGWIRDIWRLRQRPLDVVHAHFSHDHHLARCAHARPRALVRSIHSPRSIRWSLPSADAFTVPTEREAERLSGRRVCVLPPLLDPAFRPPSDRSALRAALGLEGEPLIGMVSTFQPSRRHGLGLQAFSCVLRARPTARLVLVGDGILEPELRGLVARMGMAGSVTFAGYQRGGDFVRWLQALDEVWILGLGNDFSGRAAAQARACGARTICVDEGALSQWADEVVAADPEAIAAASLAARRAMRELPRPEDVAARVVALYGEAGGGR